MLILAVALLLVWTLGMITAHTLGGLVHVLLGLAVVMIILRVLRGRTVTS